MRAEEGLACGLALALRLYSASKAGLVQTHPDPSRSIPIHPDPSRFIPIHPDPPRLILAHPSPPPAHPCARPTLPVSDPCPATPQGKSVVVGLLGTGEAYGGGDATDGSNHLPPAPASILKTVVGSVLYPDMDPSCPQAQLSARLAPPT